MVQVSHSQITLASMKSYTDVVEGDASPPKLRYRQSVRLIFPWRCHFLLFHSNGSSQWLA